jgi:putative PIN family toxin of toxin-antitoxin system
MMRVVADTNIFISALMFGGLPGEFLDLALAGIFDLVSSTTLLDELEEKLRNKFSLSIEDAAAIRTRLEGTADLVEADETLDFIKDDPDDNRVLECAMAGGANVIVSGDRHLLRLGAYSGISVLTVRQFIAGLHL